MIAQDVDDNSNLGRAPHGVIDQKDSGRISTEEVLKAFLGLQRSPLYTTTRATSHQSHRSAWTCVGPSRQDELIHLWFLDDQRGSPFSTNWTGVS